MNEEQPPSSPERPEAQPPGSNAQGRKPLARFGSVAVAVVLLILVGASVYSLVKLSSNTTNLAPLQQQVRTLQQQVRTLQAQVATDGSAITTLQGQVSTDASQLIQLDEQSAVLKIDGLATYNESCPISNVWVPCATHAPPGFTSP
jgi:uncharacterized protein HemX